MSTVFLNEKGLGIGELRGRIFRKVVSKKRHFMRVLNSWGIDKRALDELGDDVEIQILAKDEKIIYTATAKQFREDGIQKNYGHGEQIFLRVDKFTTKKVTASVLKNSEWI